jgi:hypothetical protein
MNTSSRPFTTKEKAELKKEASLPVGVVIIALLCAGLLLRLLHLLHSKLADAFPIIRPVWWWIIPWAALVGLAYFAAEWSAKGRRRTKSDLLAGNAACHLIEAVEVIEVEEQEDEGPSYFVKTTEGESLLLRGQYLERYKRQSFPWRSFEIVETPSARRFLGLRRLGEPLKPSFVRQPFTWEEMKQFGFGKFRVVDIDFEKLKTNESKRNA